MNAVSYSALAGLPLDIAQNNPQTLEPGGNPAAPRGFGSAFEMLIVGLVAILSYLPTLRFGFAYDDDVQVLANPAIKNWHYLAAYDNERGLSLWLCIVHSSERGDY